LSNFENLEPDHLKSLKQRADEHGIQIDIGAGSISRNSLGYSDLHGEPEEVIKTALRVAKTVGFPVVNVRIGNIDDRYTEGGIEARIDECVKVLKASGSRILDSGIKIGFENHAVRPAKTRPPSSRVCSASNSTKAFATCGTSAASATTHRQPCPADRGCSF